MTLFAGLLTYVAVSQRQEIGTELGKCSRPDYPRVRVGRYVVTPLPALEYSMGKPLVYDQSATRSINREESRVRVLAGTQVFLLANLSWPPRVGVLQIDIRHRGLGPFAFCRAQE